VPKATAARPPTPTASEAGPPPPKAPAAGGIETADCPAGTEKFGKSPPDGFEQYCQAQDASGRPVREGWFMSWFGNGQLASQGQYKGDKKLGKWTYFYNTGKKRLEAEYLDDQKHGKWVYWDRGGEKNREVEYQNGVEVKPVSQ
jgi:hypothetical protein